MTTATAYALISALIVSLMSFVGVLTLFFGFKRFQHGIFILIGLAVGTLFGDVLIHLLPEIFADSGGAVVKPGLLIMAGILTFFVLEKFFHWHHAHTCEGDECALPRPVGYINIASESIHNLLDGILIGASYLVSIPIGVATTVGQLGYIDEETATKFIGIVVALIFGISIEDAGRNVGTPKPKDGA